MRPFLWFQRTAQQVGLLISACNFDISHMTGREWIAWIYELDITFSVLVLHLSNFRLHRAQTWSRRVGSIFQIAIDRLILSCEKWNVFYCRDNELLMRPWYLFLFIGCTESPLCCFTTQEMNIIVVMLECYIHVFHASFQCLIQTMGFAGFSGALTGYSKRRNEAYLRIWSCQ